MKYYDISNIESKKADHNVIMSGRGPGKSYQICKMILNEWKKGKQAARIVRNLSYVSNIANWFDPGLLADFKKETGYEVSFSDTKEGTHYVIYPEGKPKEAKILCYMLVLSQEQRYKSNQYPNVWNIVTEEFALLDGTMYLENEAEKYMSLLSTIIRSRHGVRCWYIGNTITKVCPYFDMLNIDIDRLDLRPGDLKPVPQPTSSFRAPATVWVEFPVLSYELEDEIPRALRLMHNECATTGEFVKAPDIFDFDETVCTNSKKTVVFRGNDFDIAVYHLKNTRNIVYFYRCKEREKKTVPIEFQSLSSKVSYVGKDYRLLFKEWREYNAEFLYSDDAVKRLIQKAQKESLKFV